MTLQNRVSPFGHIEANAARGTLMGNRGGKLHGSDRSLGSRRWVNTRWIACRLTFRGRRRVVMGDGYTELFFLDEATALAAGHRPCFECRRADAVRFASAWGRAHGPDVPKAADIDAVLHAQRTGGAEARLRLDPRELPTGAMFQHQADAMLAVNGWARLWTHSGYGPTVALPLSSVEVLTPAGTIAAMKCGYEPEFHVSARDPR